MALCLDRERQERGWQWGRGGTHGWPHPGPCVHWLFSWKGLIFRTGRKTLSKNCNEQSFLGLSYFFKQIYQATKMYAFKTGEEEELFILKVYKLI